jgi:cobalt-zinc-cadmium efflux system membrane fusion protein
MLRWLPFMSPDRSVGVARSCRAVGLCAAVASLVGCPATVAAPRSVVPPGEVWLSADKVQQDKIDVEPVAEQDLDSTLVTSGRITFEDIKVGHIYTPVTGRVGRIDVQVGQRVKKGQSLAVIQSPDIGQASSDVAKADADLIQAEHDMQREKALLDKHATSHKDYETSEDAFKQAKAEKQRASQKAFLLRTGTIDSVTQGYTLVAPVDGEVLMRNLSLGAEVQGQYGGGSTVQELFTVGELDEVWLLADIYEVDLSRVQVGARAVVHVVAYPDKTFDGKVDWVAGMLEPSSRTAKVRCTFANSERLLKQDMYATVAITVQSRKVLALVADAVLHLGDQTVVFVDRGATADGKRRFERLPVAVDDARGGKWLPILHGLDAGDRVVTHGADVLNGQL